MEHLCAVAQKYWPEGGARWRPGDHPPVDTHVRDGRAASDDDNQHFAAAQAGSVRVGCPRVGVRQMQEGVEDVEMVVMEFALQCDEVDHGHPPCLGRVVPTTHLGQGGVV